MRVLQRGVVVHTDAFRWNPSLQRDDFVRPHLRIQNVRHAPNAAHLNLVRDAQVVETRLADNQMDAASFQMAEEGEHG